MFYNLCMGVTTIKFCNTIGLIAWWKCELNGWKSVIKSILGTRTKVWIVGRSLLLYSVNAKWTQWHRNGIFNRRVFYEASDTFNLTFWPKGISTSKVHGCAPARENSCIELCANVFIYLQRSVMLIAYIVKVNLNYQERGNGCEEAESSNDGWGIQGLK